MGRIPRDKRKYLLKESERSGFKYFKNELTLDNGRWVHPSEKDDPPPTKKYIGGEGEGNSSGARQGRTDYPTQQAEDWVDNYT